MSAIFNTTGTHNTTVSASPNPATTPQPAPQPGHTRVLDLVIQDLTDRAETGKLKYGTYLETDNGRDALADAYQEACDLVMYLRQQIEERDDANARLWQQGYAAGKADTIAAITKLLHS